MYIGFPSQISSAMWPHTSLRYGVIKAAVETISYTPAAMTCFYFIMSLLESKTVQEAVAEVGKKFLPTYKVFIPIIIYVLYTYIFFLYQSGRFSRLAFGSHHQLFVDTWTEPCAFY